MAISPTDQSQEFINSGQRLITSPSADRLLQKAAEMKLEAKRVTDEFINSKVKER